MLVKRLINEAEKLNKKCNILVIHKPTTLQSLLFFLSVFPFIHGVTYYSVLTTHWFLGPLSTTILSVYPWYLFYTLSDLLRALQSRLKKGWLITIDVVDPATSIL